MKLDFLIESLETALLLQKLQQKLFDLNCAFGPALYSLTIHGNFTLDDSTTGGLAQSLKLFTMITCAPKDLEL